MLQTQTIDLNDAKEQFYPKKVLVAYKSRESDKYYLEESDLIDGEVTGYRPASIESIKSLFSSVMAADTGYVNCGDLFPKNVLHLNITGGDFRVVWWRKVSLQLLKFDKALKIPNIKIKVPGMIYDAKRSNCKVYAHKRNTVTAKTIIFEAPYMNIMGDDSVCFGSTKIDIPAITSLEEIMYQYEKAFWGSEFTDSGSTDTLKMWKTIAKFPTINTVFHLGQLKQHKKSLQEILKS